MTERQILSMLEEGAITADEAARLLEAVSAQQSPERQGPAADGGPSGPHAAIEPDEVIPGTFAPDARRWKRMKLVPLGLSLLLLIATAWGLWAAYRAADAQITFGWVVVLLLFLFALAATTLSAWLISAPWLHVRVHRREGRTIAISLPIPLGLAGWGVRLARRYVDEGTSQYLDASAEFIRAMRHDRTRSQPLMVNVDDDDQRVQVYFG
jgi:hypothetical protein